MSKIYVKIDDVKYEWCGWFGAVIKSKENGIKLGDTRVIYGTLFYAYIIEKRIFEKNIVSWSVLNSSTEVINDIKKIFLS